MSRLDLTSLARRALAEDDRGTIERRATAMGVRVHAGLNTRRGGWSVVVMSGPHSTVLVGKGPLAAVIAGALDDWEAA